MMRETSLKKNKKNKRDKKNKGCLNIKLLVSQLFIVKYETEIVLTAYKLLAILYNTIFYSFYFKESYLREKKIYNIAYIY